jgi:2-polyprenyl-3-methyl-5-hydroxy-6-metoxy-1,4-benzoquinol methylase
MEKRNLAKAALRGEPSYVWRAGQQRRLEMIVGACILENGCGVGMYVEHLSPFGGTVIGLEYDFERAAEAGINSPHIVNATGESIPFPFETFDLILSHEVLEHVQDDRAAVCCSEVPTPHRRGPADALFSSFPIAAIHSRLMEFTGKESIILATSRS